MLIARAQWYIESFLAEPLTLERIAADCRVSTFHLTRTFTVLTGMPVMRYVWRRRLARAAEALGQDGQSVMAAALDAGYQSHEAFSRAFKAEFGLSPRQLRTGRIAPDRLVKPTFMRMPPMPRTLAPPTIETMPERRIVGLSRRYDMETRSAIPAQWAAYNEDDTPPEGWVPDRWYGIISGFSAAGDMFDYLCGVEVPRPGPLPVGQTVIVVPPGRYARFASRDHISTMSAVWMEIYSNWLGQDGLRPRQAPSLEYYPVEFDGRTGEGGFEIWLPVD
jgi:AraC family transcriptional regulator